MRRRELKPLKRNSKHILTIQKKSNSYQVAFKHKLIQVLLQANLWHPGKAIKEIIAGLTGFDWIINMHLNTT